MWQTFSVVNGVITLFTFQNQLLLRKKAAEELKKEQERKSAERRRVIDQRCGQPKSVDGLGECKFNFFLDSLKPLKDKVLFLIFKLSLEACAKITTLEFVK